MSFHAISAKLDQLAALFSSASANAEKIGALTAERDTLSASLKAITAERDTLKAAVDQANAAAEQAKSDAAAKAQEAAEAKAEAEKLRSTPTAQAAAVLAQVGHSGVAATNGASASTDEQPPAGLTGLGLAKWYHARGKGISGKR